MEIKQHPVLIVLIPLICGMTIAYFSCDMKIIGGFTLIMILLILLLSLYLTHFVKSLYSPKTFVIYTLLFFVTVGYTLESRSIASAKREFGQKWEKAIYNSGIFHSISCKKWQDRLHDIYQQNGISNEDDAIIEAMTIGRKQGITSSTRQSFSKSGLSHILALSGFHISIIYSILQILFLGKIATIKWKIISNTLTIICLWAFALVSGMSPSLVRAVIMCTIMILAHGHSNRSLSIDACGTAALIMIVADPLILFHIGFQLSFVSMIGICTIGKYFCSHDREMNNTISNPWSKTIILVIYKATMDIVIISLTCNIFTMPLVAYYFHQVPLLSIISNLMATLLVTILMVVSVLWWTTLWWHSANMILADILHFTANAITSIASSIASIPHSTIECHPPYWIIVIIYIFIVVFTYRVMRKRQLK